MPPMTTSNHKNTCIRPDSIVSAADSDLEAIVSSDGPFTALNGGRKGMRSKSGCPMHASSSSSKTGPKIISIPPADSNLPPPVVQVSKGPKQLKSILKGGAGNKPSSNITTNPLVVDPHPSSHCRESSTGSTGSSESSPPPLTDATPAVHISKASVPKPPLRTSSSMNSNGKNVSEALHV